VVTTNAQVDEEMRMITFRRSLLRVLRIGVCLAISGAAMGAAAAWPDRPIKLVVAYPPGGGTDIVARLLAPELSKRLGQPIAIDNRGGASGNIGTEYAVRSPADGYTLLMGNVAPNAINVSIYKKLPYDPQRDLSPICLVAITPNMLVVNNDVPVKSVADLVTYAKTNPGAVNFPSAGQGTSSHLAGELFNTMAQVKMTHIPYKGGGAAMTDLLGGQVQVFFATMPAAIPFVRAGKLRAIAVTSDQRALALPELPTVSESGLPGFSATTWYGLYAPKGTPADIVSRLNREVKEILAQPAMRERLIQQGFEPQGNSPEEFSSFIASEITKWARVVKAAGVVAE
jgi:tripartite-type tricarboxylate transporter receptor subunit TctC